MRSRSSSPAFPVGFLAAGSGSATPLSRICAESKARASRRFRWKRWTRFSGSSKRVAGAGSSSARLQIVRDLYRRATEDEQEFLTRLLLEDLRQGSLEGVMLEAIAKASSLPSEAVRRAFMLSGDLGSRRPNRRRGRRFRPGLDPARSLPPHPADARANGGERLRSALDPRDRRARAQARRGPDPGAQVGERGPHLQPSIERRDPGLSRDRGANSRGVRDGAWCSMGKPSPSIRRAVHIRSRRRCGASAASSTSRALRSALPLTSVYFDCLFLDDSRPHLPFRERQIPHPAPDARRRAWSCRGS